MAPPALTVLVVSDASSMARLTDWLSKSPLPLDVRSAVDLGRAWDTSRSLERFVILLDTRSAPTNEAVFTRLSATAPTPPLILLCDPSSPPPPHWLEHLHGLIFWGQNEELSLHFALMQTIRLQKGDDFAALLSGPVAHDLRSPLGIVSLSAQLQQGLDSLSELPGFTTKILNACRRLQWNIQELVTLSTLHFLGEAEWNHQPGDLVPAITERVAELQLDFPRRQLALQTRGAWNGSWDTTRLLEALRSLIETTLKNSPATSTVIIQLQGEPAEPFCLKITAQDLEIPDRIFEILSRPPSLLQLSSERDTGEFPFGLLSVPSVVRAHQGRLRVQRDDGAHGFTIDFDRPLTSL